MKKFVWVFMFVLGLFVFARHASAHVSLSPKEAAPGYNTFVVRVPNEKDIPTVGMRLLVPENVEVTGIKPVPGWTYSAKREEVMTDEETMEVGEAGHEDEELARIQEITWTGSVGVGEFQEFPVSVKYAGEPTTVPWKAYQTYSDGEVVAWDGTDEGHPAPSVKYVAVAAPATGVSGTLTAAATSQAPWLSVVAVVLSVAALGMSLKKK